MKAWAAKAARMIIGCYRRDDAIDPEMYGDALIAVLSDYPPEVVAAVADPRRGLPASSKFLPAISEVKEACEREMAPVYRERRREAERQERQKMLESPPRDPAVARRLADLAAEMKRQHRPNARGANQGTLDELCAAAGVSRDEFERINSEAVASNE